MAYSRPSGQAAASSGFADDDRSQQRAANFLLRDESKPASTVNLRNHTHSCKFELAIDFVARLIRVAALSSGSRVLEQET
jgi:hypothetical protein